MAIPRSPDPFPVSVHLCDYPVADASLIDEELAAEMDLVRDIVSLGRAARAEAKLKVRQPLALAEIILVKPEHTEWLRAHAALIGEELNIKQIEFSREADQYVHYEIKPNFKAIGPRLGALAKRIGPALNAVDAAEARRSLAATGALTLPIDGQPIRLTSEDVDTRLVAKPGWSAAQGRAGVVVVKTELTPELKEEGLIRELIHHVQDLRKEAQLPYEARITIFLDAQPDLRAIVQRHAEMVATECLAPEIRETVPAEMQARTVKIEGREVRLAIRTR